MIKHCGTSRKTRKYYLHPIDPVQFIYQVVEELICPKCKNTVIETWQITEDKLATPHFRIKPKHHEFIYDDIANRLIGTICPDKLPKDTRYIAFVSEATLLLARDIQEYAWKKVFY